MAWQSPAQNGGPVLDWNLERRGMRRLTGIDEKPIYTHFPSGMVRKDEPEQLRCHKPGHMRGRVELVVKSS